MQLKRNTCDIVLLKRFFKKCLNSWELEMHINTDTSTLHTGTHIHKCSNTHAYVCLYQQIKCLLGDTRKWHMERNEPSQLCSAVRLHKDLLTECKIFSIGFWWPLIHLMVLFCDILASLESGACFKTLVSGSMSWKVVCGPSPFFILYFCLLGSK